MRIRAEHLLTAFGLGFLLLALPVWAHTDTTQMEISSPTVIAGTQLKPGEYELRVKDGATQASIVQDGKVVAEVPCQWIQLPKKAESSQITFSNDQITEIDFGGKTEALQFHS
jgi:hypothetical protein